MELLEEVIGRALSKANSFNVIVTPFSHQELLRTIICMLNTYTPHTVQYANTSIKFNNGSIVYVMPDSNPERLRGCRIDFCVILSPGNITDLDYLEKAIILPATFSTNGIIKKEENNNE